MCFTSALTFRIVSLPFDRYPLPGPLRFHGSGLDWFSILGEEPKSQSPAKKPCQVCQITHVPIPLLLCLLISFFIQNVLLINFDISLRFDLITVLSICVILQCLYMFSGSLHASRLCLQWHNFKMYISSVMSVVNTWRPSLCVNACPTSDL